MNTLGEKRDIVPIWRPAYEAAKSPELLPIKDRMPVQSAEPKTEQVLIDFLKDQNLGTAADLLNASLLEGDVARSVIAAQYIYDSSEQLPALQAISRRVLGLEAVDASVTVVTEIGMLRSRLAQNPQNPLGWVDLARAYTVINEKSKSEKAMWVALRYANNHRWIARMAARLFVHFDELGKAHRVLLKNENVKSDPWLLSTELAVSRLAERPLRYWNQAKKLVDSNILPVHLSELSSSIATSEILNGADKKARAFFKKSLIAPNSNSLAQLKWADRSYKLGFAQQIENTLAHTSSAHEAKYWEAYEKGHMWLALGHAHAWWLEEPYSASPPQAITYVASLVNDMQLLSRTAERGLKANPGDTTLKLNYLFSQLYGIGYEAEFARDNLEKVTRVLRTVMHGDDKNEAAHAVANVGMLAYRIGQPELGKEYYEQAELYYEKSKNTAQLFLLLNHLRESLIAGSPWAEELRDKIKSKLGQPKSISSVAAEFYLKQIQNLEGQSGTWKEKFALPFVSNDATLVGSHESGKKSSSLESLAMRFWLPSDFVTANQALQKLKDDMIFNENKK